MKKWISAILALAAAFALQGAGTVATVSAADSGTVVYSEDFQDNATDIQVWGTDPSVVGTMTIATEGTNKFLKCVTSTGDGENGYTHTAFGPTLRNFDFECRFRPDNIKNPDYNWAKILFRADSQLGENKSYIFELWGWRAAMSVKDAADRKSETTKVAENQDITFDNGTWYTIKISGRDTKFTVYVNNQKACERTDSTDLLKEGIFGFASWGTNFSVDDIKITSYDAKDQVVSSTAPAGTGSTGVSKAVSQNGGGAKQVSSAKAASAAGSGTAPAVSDADSLASSNASLGNSAEDLSSSSAGTQGRESGGPNAGAIILIVLAALVVAGGGVTAFLWWKNHKIHS